MTVLHIPQRFCLSTSYRGANWELWQSQCYLCCASSRRGSWEMKQCQTKVLKKSCCCRTRAEFQTWAEEVASTHDYTVTFSGIGSAEEEQKVLQHPSWPRDVTDVGTATQVRPCHINFCRVWNCGHVNNVSKAACLECVQKTDSGRCIQVAIFKCNDPSTLPAES